MFKFPKYSLKKSLKVFTYVMIIGCMLGLFIANIKLMQYVADIMVYAEHRMEIFEEYRNQRMAELEEFIIDMAYILNENDANQLALSESIYNNMFRLHDATMKYVNKTKKSIDLENAEEIKKANLLIYNFTKKTSGSGTHIKINNKSYVLTCAHLLKKEDDEMWADIYDIKLIKIDKENDLALYEFAYEPNLPYLKISTEAPKEASEVVVVGNPATLEDMITNGIVADIEKGCYVLTNKIFFGNSGGALIYKGKLVGVITTIVAYFYRGQLTSYAYACELEVIQEFLKDVE